MLDYHGDFVALSRFTSALAAAAFPQPAVADAQAKAVAALTSEGDRAVLGAFVHHLLTQAASDGVEVALLQRAADLWARALDLYTQLGSARADLEGALENPSAPESAGRFNAAAVSAQQFANSAIDLRVEIDSLRSDVLKFPHLPAHPRQNDQKTDAWDWGNLNLARRTDAFVRAMFRRATNPELLAFALGAAAAYGANVAGSAYVGHAVGGPRRTHRHRDRIARNSVGSWLAAHHPASVSPTVMANRITFGAAGAPALPAELELLIRDALTDTFDTSRTLPLPDLQNGYNRLVQHLTLLDKFVRPASPTPPDQKWLSTLYADPQNPPPTLVPQDVDVKGQDGGGAAVTFGPSSPGSGSPSKSDSSDTAKGCGVVLVILIVIDLLQAFVQCIGQWANKHTCTFWDNMLLKKVFEEDPPDPRDKKPPTDPGQTSEDLVAIATSPQAAQLVGMLFDVHCRVWEAIDRAYAFLAITGLIYPGDLITMPVYAQFTALPGDLPWPRREEVNATATYHLYPSSPLENPTNLPSPFAAAAQPDVYLGPGGQVNATDITLGLWRQIAAGELDSANRDLDADRGSGHPCWAASGSVLVDPIDVVILKFDEQ